MNCSIKSKLPNRPSERASVLAVTLCTAMVLCLGIWSYLTLIQNQNLSVVRSQAWNTSLAVAEAGVEEALAQLNPGVFVGNVDRTANGWGSPVNGEYGPITRTLSAGTYAVNYTTDPSPIIYSAGSATVPFMSVTVSRVIRVTTTNLPLFNVGLGALNSITMNGSGIEVNSFDSSSTNLSTNGHYDSTKTSTNGNVASVYGPVDFGNHSIAGNLYLGPTATFTSSSNQVSGTVYDDFNVNYPDVVLPSLTYTNSPSTTTNRAPDGNVYNHIFLTAGNYVISDSGSIYVGTNAGVIVEVTAANWNPGAVNIAGSTTNSGNLTVYMAGASASLGGNTTVNSGAAANFTYYGLPSNTSLTCSGSSTFVGSIYAPEVSLTLNGGGSSNDLMGAFIVNNATMDGHYRIHYDQALLKNGPVRGYTAASWTEL
jgi:hypothetical protein